MRIISGRYKYKPIYTSVKGSEVKYRPTSSKVRAAIFNILAHAGFLDRDVVTDGVFADICCGSGSVGLEALSRGASKAYFVDINSTQTEMVRANLENFKTQQGVVLTCSASNLPYINDKCDVVFIDLPYNNKDVLQPLNSLVQKQWVDENSVVVLEVDKRTDLKADEAWEVLDERKYNKTKLIFLGLLRKRDHQ